MRTRFFHLPMRRSAEARARLEFVGVDHAGQEILESLPLTFRKGNHDLIPHRKDCRVKSFKEIDPRRGEAEQPYLAAAFAPCPADEAAKLKVLDHPLSAREVNANPLSQSPLVDVGSIVEGGKNRRLDQRQALWPRNLQQRAVQDRVKAAPQVELTAAVNRRKDPERRMIGVVDEIGQYGGPRLFTGCAPRSSKVSGNTLATYA
jgi:hypothetical protein